MKKKKILILNYGLGNLFSILQALNAVGADAFVSGDPAELQSADGVLLPGVGAFGNAMEKLTEKKMIDPILNYVKGGGPIMGICLGMQLLFQSSEEFGAHTGLQLIDGRVERFPDLYQGVKLRVPFMGWNNMGIDEKSQRSTLLTRLKNTEKIYLVHSYFAVPSDPKIVLATCSYHGFKYPTIVQKNNITGIQGHPEKSSECGLNIYRGWLEQL